MVCSHGCTPWLWSAGVPINLIRVCLEDAFDDGDESLDSPNGFADVMKVSGLEDYGDEDEPCLPNFEEAVKLVEERWEEQRVGRMASLRHGVSGPGAGDAGTQGPDSHSKRGVGGKSRRHRSPSSTGRTRGRGYGRLSRSPQRTRAAALSSVGPTASVGSSRKVVVYTGDAVGGSEATSRPLRDSGPETPVALKERSNGCKDTAARKKTAFSKKHTSDDDEVSPSARGRRLARGPAKSDATPSGYNPTPLERHLSSFRPSTLWKMISAGTIGNSSSAAPVAAGAPAPRATRTMR